jgi:mannitol/fructose-specific phosphotransferase system IIA component (Ntr-type)
MPSALLDILTPATIRVPLKATTRQDAIYELVDMLAAQGDIGDAAVLRESVWERERQRSTGIGEGLAIPHGKCPGARAVRLAIGKPALPLEWDAIDHRPVRLVCLLVSPPDRIAEHIQALGRISRVMSNAAFRAQCYEAASAERMYELFTAVERSA